jgi:hypothetical protein
MNTACLMANISLNTLAIQEQLTDIASLLKNIREKITCMHNYLYTRGEILN